MTNDILTQTEAEARLAELLLLGGYPAEIRCSVPPKNTDPRWVHLVRPDGGHRRVWSSTIRALVKRGLLVLASQAAELPTPRKQQAGTNGRVYRVVEQHARVAQEETR